jgi:hypothetical protein
MNIGLLIICTGRYNIFLNSLYESCEKHFLPKHKKTYYVFTEGDVPINENVIKIYQEYMGFPNDTLKRFHLFHKNNNLLGREDYLFFLNANMLCVSEINEEIIPSQNNDNLMAVNHPGFYNKSNLDFTYERNISSNFYIPIGQGKHYYQGCFNGGSSTEFLKMSYQLSKLIDEDEMKGIIPIWWDESALNWYLRDRNPLLINSGYAYPEGWELPMDKKIIQRDKNKHGGYNYLRKII